MAIEISYKDHTDYRIYPISKQAYFKRTYGHGDYTEYELVCGNLSFYASNNSLFPLRIYNNRMEERYIVSVQFGTALNRDKLVYHEESGERLDLQFSENDAFSSNEVICKKGQTILFGMYEQKKLFADNSILLKGTIEGHELELFITFLCFFIKYDESFS